MNRLRQIMIGLGLSAIIAAGLVVGNAVHDRRAQAATLGQAEAATLAIKYAQASSPAGWLVSAPTQINAKEMPLSTAFQLKDGRPLDPATKVGREGGRSVWLVFLRGTITVPGMPVPGKAPPPATYHQMSVVLAADTGELLSIGIYPPTHELAAATTLPTVAVPISTKGITPPVVVHPTEAPLPTRSSSGH